MLFNALLSDDENHVLVFSEGEDEPEEYTVSEFIQFFGDEELAKLQEEYKKAHQVLPDTHEISVYYDAFIKFLEVDGHYIHSLKMYRNSIGGSEHVNEVVNKYYKTKQKGLLDQIDDLKAKRISLNDSLDFWLKKVGLEPIPKKSNRAVSPNRLTLQSLSNLIYNKSIVRSRMKEKIRKHQKEGILYSPEEILEETLLSFRIVKQYSGEGTTLQELIKIAHKVL